MITYYEIVSGLKHRDAQKQLGQFLEFASQNIILSLTREAADIAAELYADLRKKGQPIDDIDLLIAGIAMANGLVMATQNRKHFDRIAELKVKDWSEGYLLNKMGQSYTEKSKEGTHVGAPQHRPNG